MDKNIKLAIAEEIYNSSIPEEMKLMYLLAGGLQSIVLHVCSRINAVYKKHGYRCVVNDKIKGVSDYSKMILKASEEFEARIQPLINELTWEQRENDSGNVTAFDGFNAKANELVRLCMNYMNAEDPDKMYAAIFTAMKRNAAKNPIFEDKVISHYKIKL